MKNRGLWIWKMMLTTCVQAAGAPFCDLVSGTDQQGRRYRGRCFLLTPWRRNRFGESVPQRALVVGWRTKA